MKTMLRQLLYRLTLGAAMARKAKPQRRFALGVLKLDRLGDGVLALGAVRRLLAKFDEADTLLVVSPLAEPLFRAEFPAATLLVLPSFCGHFFPDYLSFLFGHSAPLRNVSVERLVCLRHQPSDYLHSVARLLAPGRCYASRVKQPWESVCLDYPVAQLAEYPEAPQPQCLELEAHRRVVEMAIGEPVALAEMLPEVRSAQPVDGDALLVCPEAGDPLRIYPAALLAEAVRLIVSARPMPVEVCLPPMVDETRWATAFKEAGVTCRTWHRPKDAVALIEVLARAGVILANDSAPAHLATAMDKRGVFLLGGGHFGFFAPWRRSERQRWIYNPIDCYQCHWNCIHPEPYCITGIAPERIAEALTQVLNA
ncbi:MAG: glycosyltransferase family 9 protein [Prosthecobacter sp.]|nr:glycosyltransferase family 9 protein [Prosthecobacter sp.]